ncbi:hypothetical protein EGH21_03675 [Halomicroarcula sp. F13]|uniref:Uncharacterized protein n=1 Tax=Haloarcula rubra TaxID=2487747 RepID=A0AAW4PM27_9EURY|nr:hypothetical protein [Halomicroarcula rubra]MBX0322127.1 hypothetical protein [Halomicroarcula rubra]
MPTPRQRRFLYAQVGLTLTATALLATVGALTLEHVFVVSFLGFAVLTALTAPLHARPRWRSRLRWPLLVGAVVFLVLVALRTLEKFVGSI